MPERQNKNLLNNEITFLKDKVKEDRKVLEKLEVELGVDDKGNIPNPEPRGGYWEASVEKYIKLKNEVQKVEEKIIHSGESLDDLNIAGKPTPLSAPRSGGLN